MNHFFRRFIRLAGLVTSVFCAVFLSSAQASDRVTPYRVLIETCMNCHGTDGVSTSSIPSLAGQSEAVLKAKIAAYKKLPNSESNTIMTRLVSSLSTEEMTALATYYSSIQPSSITVTSP